MFASGKAAAVASAANYIEDVFSTYLYTGNGSTQTITNGIDLSTYGGLVVAKSRTNGTSSMAWLDTNRGSNYTLRSNNTNQSVSFANSLTSFNTNGFSLGADPAGGFVNANTETFASWTFREQPKFFDVVTFTSNASGGATINHSLASAPGCVIVKSTAAAGNWFVYHVGMDPAEYMFLNTTAAAANGGRTVTTSSTQVTYPSGYFANSTAYVAYLFASNAGGFGLTGTDNVISCGSFTAAASITNINLGYEPQWLLIKRTDGVGNWQITDNMRTWCDPKSNLTLFPNLTNAETNPNTTAPSAVGFSWESTVGQSWIYIAIRRGPMKVPTDGTSVFAAQNNRNGPGSATAPSFVSNFPIDMFMRGYKPGGSASFQWLDDRLRDAYLVTSATDAEAATGGWKFDCQTGVYFQSLASSTSEVGWMFRRAPSFFDEVCYTGNFTANRNINHNLGVTPELMIMKSRSASYDWNVYHTFTGSGHSYAFLNTTAAGGSATYSAYGENAPTSTTFSVGADNGTNASGGTYVAYLFATCAGVSKVGSYTGTGSTQTISCGFTGGARFVLIKRTNSTGDWYVWDTARGMVSGTDPSLLLNSTAAEVNANSIYTTTGGFQIVSTAAGINASGGTYIYLAIA
jgi:hypothetical protein